MEVRKHTALRGEVWLCLHRKQKAMDLFKVNEDQIWSGETSWKKTWIRKKKNYRTGDIYADPLTWEQLWDWMRHDKSCWLQSPHDLLLHAIFSYGMDRGLVIQSKQTCKVNRCLLPAQTKNKQTIIFSWLVHIAHTKLVLIQAYMLPLRVCVFSEKKKKGLDTNEDK